MRSNKVFFVALLCVLALTILMTYGAKQLVPQFITPYWPLQISLLAVVSTVVYFLNRKVARKNDAVKMTHFHMMATVVKLVVYLAVISIYAIMFPQDGKAFIISFLAYYICFAIFETTILVKTVKE